MKPSCLKAKPKNGLATAIQCSILWCLALGFGNDVGNAGYQKPCTDIRIDLENVLAQEKLIGRQSHRFNEAETQRIEELLQAAKANPQCLFNSLSDGDAFSLVKALCRLEAYFGDGSNSHQIFLWGLFINQYPGSSHLDEARWLRAKTAATPYEYEGYADAALQQIESIEAFIKENSANSHLADAELELARACRIAYEAFRYGDGLSTNSNEDRQKAGRKYRSRARQLLHHLCSQSQDRVREDACRALKELEAGKCVYIGPGSPNPHFPDNWAVSPQR